MVTVIADKEDLPTPVNNGVMVASNDNERPFQYIKDYQEVKFHLIFCFSTEILISFLWVNFRLIFIDQFHVNLYLMIYSD